MIVITPVMLTGFPACGQTDKAEADGKAAKELKENVQNYR